jgi:hypothetical protein
MYTLIVGKNMTNLRIRVKSAIRTGMNFQEILKVHYKLTLLLVKLGWNGIEHGEPRALENGRR